MRKLVFMLHCGGDTIRGTEICFIESFRALFQAGYQIVVYRNEPAMDKALIDIDPKVAIFSQNFPEIMIAGRRETTLPLLQYARALTFLYKQTTKFKPTFFYCSGGLPCQLAIPIGKVLNTPILCHFHHPAILRAYYFWLVKFANKLIFPSRFTLEHSRSKANLSGTIIYNGIDLDRFCPLTEQNYQLRNSLGIPTNAIVIGQVGALVQNKRPDFLLRAFALLLNRNATPLYLCLVGKGPMESLLHSLTAMLNITDRVIITGYVEDVLPYYQQVFDINTLVSDEEGLGISAIEGSACGLPIVVSRCTGLVETILDEKTGYSFSHDSPEAFCTAIQALIDDQNLRARMGAQGREFALTKFSADVYRQELINEVEQLMRKH